MTDLRARKSGPYLLTLERRKGSPPPSFFFGATRSILQKKKVEGVVQKKHQQSIKTNKITCNCGPGKSFFFSL